MQFILTWFLRTSPRLLFTGRGKSDPGIRNQIFIPMLRNQDGYDVIDRRFITSNKTIKVATINQFIYFVNSKLGKDS